MFYKKKYLKLQEEIEKMEMEKEINTKQKDDYIWDLIQKNTDLENKLIKCEKKLVNYEKKLKTSIKETANATKKMNKHIKDTQYWFKLYQDVLAENESLRENYDIAKCDLCGCDALENELIDTEGMINGGVGCVCQQCLEDYDIHGGIIE